MTAATSDKAAVAAALMERARALVPVVRERAAEAERLRRIPQETDRDFRAAGFYRVLQPAMFGGTELDYGTHTELSAEVARGCPSSGWALGITASHAWIFSMFPPEAQKEFWGADPEAAIATSFFGEKVTLAREAGGFRLKGRWKFSSNVDNCQAVLLLAVLPPAGGAGRPNVYFLFVPRRDYKVEDTWHAAGLMATGSNDVVVENALVPEHYVVDIALCTRGKAPGGAFHANPLYRLPLYAVFPYTLIGAAVGAAQGALEHVAGMLEGRSAALSQIKVREQTAVQMRVGEATAEINAARALLRQDSARFNALAKAGQFPDTAERASYRLNLGYACKLCVSAVERLYPLGGAQGLAAGDPLQRAWRDAHAVSAHIALVWDIQAANYGALRLGLPCPDPRI
ncbi:MAG: acyl-CoA dehydrogenase family protein [Alphaproteobacteria bacterium]|nr:acyl-CoA dehydrogenase family protein [Alphaproteobacteria bacterium]